MAFLQYSLAAIVTFSGLFIGAFLARSTKEEMPTASKYLPWLQKIIVIAISAVLLNHFNISIALKIAVYAILIFALLRFPILNLYPILAVVFFGFGQWQNLFAVSALVFLYGFPTGSMFIIKSRKMSRYGVVESLFRKYGVFLLIAIGLQLLYSLLVLKSLN